MRSRRSASGASLPSPAPPTSTRSRPRSTAVMGRKSRFGELQRSLGSMAEEDRRAVGAVANEVREALQAAAAERPRRRSAPSPRTALLDADRLDLVAAGPPPCVAARCIPSASPSTRSSTSSRARLPRRRGTGDRGRLAQLPGAQHPADHPARTMKDSLYVDVPGHPELLLRTETSAVQIRTMQSQPPPVYVVAPGPRVSPRDRRPRPTRRCSIRSRGSPSTRASRSRDMKGVAGDVREGAVRRGTAGAPGSRRTSRSSSPAPSSSVSCFVCDGAGCRVCGNGWIELLGCGHGAPERPGELRVRQRALHGLRVRHRHRPRGDASLRDPRHPDALRRRRPLPGAVRGRRREGRPVVAPRVRSDRISTPRSSPSCSRARGVEDRGRSSAVGRASRAWSSRASCEVRDHPDSDKLASPASTRRAASTRSWWACATWRPGDLVPWAPPGARVPALAEPLGARELRGVVSNGMLCSPSELAISADHGGILLLTTRASSRATTCATRSVSTTRCSTSRSSRTGRTSCRCSASRARSPPRPACRSRRRTSRSRRTEDGGRGRHGRDDATRGLPALPRARDPRRRRRPPAAAGRRRG